jgi:hypothetical protein
VNLRQLRIVQRRDASVGRNVNCQNNVATILVKVLGVATDVDRGEVKEICCVHTANKLSVLARSRGGLARPRKAEPHTAGAGRHGQGCDHAGRHWDVAELSTGPDDLTHAVRSGAEQLLSEPARGFSVLGIGGGAPPPINDM